MKRRVIALVMTLVLVISMVPVVHGALSINSAIVHFQVYLMKADGSYTTTPIEGISFRVNCQKDGADKQTMIATTDRTNKDGQVTISLDPSLLTLNYVIDCDPTSVVAYYNGENLNHIPATFKWLVPNGKKNKVRIMEKKSGSGTLGNNDHDVYKLANDDFEITYTCYVAVDTPQDYYTVYTQNGTKGTAYALTDTPDVTKLVKEGYLYGGLATDNTYEKPFTDKIGTALTGAKGNTFYVREIKNDYLQPATMAVQRREADTVEHYMLTALDKDGVDNDFYKGYGFMNADDPSMAVFVGDEDDEIEASMSSNLYVSLQKVRRGQTEDTFTAESIFHLPGDYIGCMPLNAVPETIQGYSFDNAFTPFYVTADGVLVTGTVRRYMSLLSSMTPTIADLRVESKTSAYSGGALKKAMVKSVYRAADAPVNENLSAIDIPETPAATAVTTSFVRAILDEDSRFAADVTATGAEVTFEDGLICVNGISILDDSAIRNGLVYSGDITAPGVPEGTSVTVAMYHVTENKQLLWCTSITYVCRDGVLRIEVPEV